MIYWKNFDFSSLKFNRLKKYKKDEYTANIIMAFDIETTSLFKIDGKWQTFDFNLAKDNPEIYKQCERNSFCYIWQFGFKMKNQYGIYENTVVYGRYLFEFKILCQQLLELFENTKFIIYIHNLSFEFQFLRNVFDDFVVFARKERKPMKVDCLGNMITFKCSYILSGLSLDMVAKTYNLDVQKKIGKLDYNIAHFSDTELSKDELEYCEYDILVLLDYLFIEFEKVRYIITSIPLTATSKVRRALKKKYVGNYKYLKKMQLLVPQVNEMKALMKTYMGATTHANPLWVGVECSVRCRDLTSSYPTVLIARKYACSPFYKIKPKKLSEIDNENFSFMGKFRLTNLKSKLLMNYISFSKCVNYSNIFCENGKVISADSVEIYLTDVDINIIDKCYDYDIEILDLWIAKKDYLDLDFVELILDFYYLKTQFKGYSDSVKLLQYLSSKEKLNSFYGMCVTSLVANNIKFNSEKGWEVEKLSDIMMSEILDKQRTSKSTLLAYSTGVWCTAYARERLWLEGLIPLNKDVVYTDTDSVKYFDDKKWDIHFKKCNQKIFKELEIACRGRLDLLVKLCPKDKFGVIHPLGIWDDEGYCLMKSWGSKKYATIKRKNGKDTLELTVAGLNKQKALLNPNLKSLADFEKDLVFDCEYSGRMIAYYNDNQEPIVVENHVIDNNKYGIVLQPTSYTLGLTNEYDEFITQNSYAYNSNIISEYLKEV